MIAPGPGQAGPCGPFAPWGDELPTEKEKPPQRKQGGKEAA